MENLKKEIIHENTKGLYKCAFCEKEFKTTKSLKSHFSNVHRLEKEHQCNICQKVFNLQSILTLHVKTVHENKKYYKCDSCGKTTNTIRQLRIIYV